MKKKYFPLCSAVIFLLTGFTACTSTVKTDVMPSSVSSASKAQKTLYKGEGFVIAVLAPRISSWSEDDWMPQSFQGNLTGLFATYSRMTVVDRKNEVFALAEQELSESGFYSEEHIVEIGKMTNAQYITVGTIRKLGNVYECNFRINESATNEIKAAYSSRCSYADIESGKVVKVVARELMENIGIEFSDTELAKLLQDNDTEIQSTTLLARGDAANNSNRYIEALAFYSRVGGTRRSEAGASIHSMLSGSFDTTSIQSRVTYYKMQTEKWNKIFRELESYVNKNISIIVYDFSLAKDVLNMQYRTVDFTITPGIKVFANRETIVVWKTVLDEWRVLLENRENDVWTGSVEKPLFGYYDGGRLTAQRWVAYNIRYEYVVTVGVYNGSGELVKKVALKPAFEITEMPYYADANKLNEPELSTQKSYYRNAAFRPVYIKNIKLEDIENGMNLKIVDVQTRLSDGSYMRIDTIYSDSDWQQM
ncbi:MAG: hypothetical protein IJ191_08545 [Treponema sp.]|nr:hypothetical protein [Treponema sp.]